jgi:hypothetical protein
VWLFNNELSVLRYLFTMQEGESKFGPDPEQFQLSQRALAKKAKREAAAVAAAEAAAARRQEEELGGVVDARRPKKQKKTAEATQAEAEESSRKYPASLVAAALDSNDGDAEDEPVASVQKGKKTKEKLRVESPVQPRSYPDSVAWGAQGVALDGRIAAAIDDMASDPPSSARVLAALRATIVHPKRVV